MKKLYVLLGFILISVVTQAQNQPQNQPQNQSQNQPQNQSQNQPVDSLYLWVDFSEDKILIDIPDRYMHYRLLPAMLPSHVRVRTVNTFVPNLPAKPALVIMLQKELQETHSPQNRQQQLKYLGKIVLLLFYTNNDHTQLPAEVINTLKQLTQNDTVKKEAALVEKWVVMATQ